MASIEEIRENNKKIGSINESIRTDAYRISTLVSYLQGHVTDMIFAPSLTETGNHIDKIYNYCSGIMSATAKIQALVEMRLALEKANLEDLKKEE